MPAPESYADAMTLMREILGDSYTHLHVERVRVEETLDPQNTCVTCEVTDTANNEKFDIVGHGTGVVDAFFHAMVERFAAEYPSLKTIHFSSFSLQALLDTKKNFAGTDAETEVTLQISNSEGKLFPFSHSSRSMISSSIITSLLGLEYFINSERAFVTIYYALKDAKARNRSDLVQRYSNSLAILVQNTSYSQVIEKLRKEMP